MFEKSEVEVAEERVDSKVTRSNNSRDSRDRGGVQIQQATHSSLPSGINGVEMSRTEQREVVDIIARRKEDVVKGRF